MDGRFNQWPMPMAPMNPYAVDNMTTMNPQQHQSMDGIVMSQGNQQQQQSKQSIGLQYGNETSQRQHERSSHEQNIFQFPDVTPMQPVAQKDVYPVASSSQCISSAAQAYPTIAAQLMSDPSIPQVPDAMNGPLKIPDIDSDTASLLMSLGADTTPCDDIDELDPSVREMLCAVPRTEDDTKARKVFDQPIQDVVHSGTVVQKKKDESTLMKILQLKDDDGDQSAVAVRGPTYHDIVAVEKKRDFSKMQQQQQKKKHSMPDSQTRWHHAQNIRTKAFKQKVSAVLNKNNTSGASTLRTLYLDPNVNNLYLFAAIAIYADYADAVRRKAHQISDIIKFEEWVVANKNDLKTFAAVPSKLQTPQENKAAVEEDTDLTVSEYAFIT